MRAGLSLRRVLRRLSTPRFADAPEGGYRTIEPAPGQLIDAGGAYTPGWYDGFDGALNLDRAAGPTKRFHRWFFVHIDGPEWFVGANIAHLGIGGNSGIVALNKRTGEIKSESVTGVLLANQVDIDAECRRFYDGKTGSLMMTDADVFTVDVAARGLRLQAELQPALGAPFVQATRFHGGHGALQFWGNLGVESARLSDAAGLVVEFDRGTPAAYDRSMGHRRPIESWNWMITTGSTIAGTAFALHLAVDRPAARPTVDAAKAVLWLDGGPRKLPEIRIEYDVLDRELSTGPWRITSGEAPYRVDFVFEPVHHRRDRHRVPLVFNVDHSQYFGRLSGTIYAPDGEHRIEDVFATTEETVMIV